MSHSHPQFPRFTQGTPRTMTPFWRPRTASTLQLGLSYGSPSNKSCGVDKKPASLVKETANASAAPLSMFFNLSVKKRRLPKLWKSADITPIHKDGEREPVENYRGERS